MVSLAALPFVLDAACSVSAFCERLWEMTLVCCRWSCIMCRAFVTRSFRDRLRCAWCCNRRIVPSPPGVVPSLLPPTGSLPLGVTGGAAVAHGEQEADLCGNVGTSRFRWSRVSGRGECRREDALFDRLSAFEGFRAWQHAQFDTFFFVSTRPNQSPESSIWVHIWNQVRRGESAKTFAVGRGVNVADNDVCKVFSLSEDHSSRRFRERQSLKHVFILSWPLPRTVALAMLLSEVHGAVNSQ